jgi:hypothetical protein
MVSFVCCFSSDGSNVALVFSVDNIRDLLVHAQMMTSLLYSPLFLLSLFADSTMGFADSPKKQHYLIEPKLSSAARLN